MNPVQAMRPPQPPASTAATNYARNSKPAAPADLLLQSHRLSPVNQMTTPQRVQQRRIKDPATRDHSGSRPRAARTPRGLASLQKWKRNHLPVRNLRRSEKRCVASGMHPEATQCFSAPLLLAARRVHRLARRMTLRPPIVWAFGAVARTEVRIGVGHWSSHPKT
jgi:hypothetical protein